MLGDPNRRAWLMGAFAVTAAPACSNRPRKVRGPTQGVALRWDLNVGTSFDGPLVIGTSRVVEGLADQLTQSVECQARMLVMKRLPEGVLVRVTFRNVGLDWSVPPSVGMSADEFGKLASDALPGLELNFALSSRGKLTAAPTGPSRPPPELTGLLDMLGLAATLGFVELPRTPVRVGATWIDPPSPTLARLGAPHIDAVLRRLEQPRKDGPTLARIEQTFTREQPVETETGPKRRQIEGTTALLLHPDGIPKAVETELTDFDPARGRAVSRIAAQWTRVAKGDVRTTEIRLVDGPCHPDYVGPELCPEPS